MMLRGSIALVALLGVVTGALAYHLSRQPLPEVRAPRGVAEAPSTSTALEATPPGRLDLSLFPDLVQRPPFAENRRPASAAVARSGEPEPAAPGRPAPVQSFEARLLGVISDGEEHLAVLAPTDARPTEFVRRGSEIEGWVVEIIDDRRVILRNGVSKVEIMLFDAP